MAYYRGGAGGLCGLPELREGACTPFMPLFIFDTTQHITNTGQGARVSSARRGPYFRPTFLCELRAGVVWLRAPRDGIKACYHGPTQPGPLPRQRYTHFLSQCNILTHTYESNASEHMAALRASHQLGRSNECAHAQGRCPTPSPSPRRSPAPWDPP
jgi:hypothetical protein